MLDSADLTFGCGCGAEPIANLRGGGLGPSLSPVWLDLQRTSEEGLAEGAAAQAGHMSRCAVHLRSLGSGVNLGLKSLNQYSSPCPLAPQQRKTCRLTLPIGTLAEGRHTHTQYTP